MTKEKLEQFKKALLAEREKVVADRTAYAAETHMGTLQDASGDLSDTDPNDPGDEAANLYDRDRDVAAVETASRILAKIDRALAKIEDGTYGLSDIDGRPIPEARLEAMPWAVTTVDQEE
jgi:RNA polymerase-binding transcription factor DksA